MPGDKCITNTRAKSPALVQSSEKSLTSPVVTIFRINFLIMQHRCEVSHFVPIFPHVKSSGLHASEFASSEVFL